MASTSDAVLPSDVNASLIDQFCSVTGSNVEKAKKMLEVCNWNLEMAVNMHVDSDYQENGAVAAINGIELDGVRAPIPQSRATLVDEEPIFHFGLRGRKRRPHSVFDGFRDFQAEADLQEQNSTEETNENLKKRRTLEDLFRPPLDIMHRGNFDSAKDTGQVSNKWLMVNLQDSLEFSCQVLNRDVWSNKDVKQLISENFIFWQVYSDSMDGQRFMQFYKTAGFPYIAVLDPRTGEKLVEWHNVNASSLCDHIHEFLEEHNGSLGVAAKVTKPPSLFSLLDQSEEEQLRAALAASVQESTLVNVEDNDSDVETFDSDSESAGGMAKMAKVSNHSDHSNDTIDVVGVSESIPGMSNGIETYKDYLGSDSDPKSQLVLRLPDGKREQISWPCTTKLKALVLYAEDMGFDPEEYELVTNYPRRNLCQLDLLKSLKEVDLFPREMIFVQLKT